MSNKITLSIVTPTRRLVDYDADMVIMKAVEGEIGVLSGHEPLTTPLSQGVLRIVNDGEEKALCVLGGFVEIQPDKITVVTDAAEWPEEIDKNRAIAAKERAENRLKNTQSDIDVSRAELSLKRALARINISK